MRTREPAHSATGSGRALESVVPLKFHPNFRSVGDRLAPRRFWAGKETCRTAFAELVRRTKKDMFVYLVEEETEDEKEDNGFFGYSGVVWAFDRLFARGGRLSFVVGNCGAVGVMSYMGFDASAMKYYPACPACWPAHMAAPRYNFAVNDACCSRVQKDPGRMDCWSDFSDREQADSLISNFMKCQFQ